MQPKFATHKEAREAGWFSRRYQTREAHEKAKESRKKRQGAKSVHTGGDFIRQQVKSGKLQAEEALLFLLGHGGAKTCTADWLRRRIQQGKESINVRKM